MTVFKFFVKLISVLKGMGGVASIEGNDIWIYTYSSRRRDQILQAVMSLAKSDMTNIQSSQFKCDGDGYTIYSVMCDRSDKPVTRRNRAEIYVLVSPERIDFVAPLVDYMPKKYIFI